ncbi:MAG: hypothetical protein ACYTDV_18130, partial [Planctomycetota bacterium]
VAFAEVLLRKANVPTGIVIDCSHANSDKDHKRQREALYDVAGQIAAGNRLIAGVMLESFLREGNQRHTGAPRIRSVIDRRVHRLGRNRRVHSSFRECLVRNSLF